MKDKEYYVNNLNVLYEDNHLIVVEKYKDVLSQKDITNDIDMNEIVKEYIKIKYQKPGAVYLGLIHRLDRRVGGVMVFAKTSKAASRLSEDIRKNNMKKYYYAVVKGTLTKGGTIDIKLLKDEKENIAIVHKDGKSSILNYQVVRNNGKNTLVLIELITGRYNQIRASFAHIGYPLINDYKYDTTQKPNNLDIALWCYKIIITHPVTKEVMEFSLEPKGEIWQ